VKVISGDNAISVGAVAASLELPHAASPVDARTLPDARDGLADEVERGTVFGRVTPAQKRAMVGALQSRGHTVAMTGDGVNDVLALKDADIGVAMGSGSPATRAVAQIVLLDNRFATLPHVVAEGRRVIGNIERVSNLFLTKTVYSVLLALMIGLAGVPYPFLPRHVSIIGWFTIGVPAFFLALAPNHERARTGFVSRVMRMAIPAGIVVAAATFTAYLLARQDSDGSGVHRIQDSTTAWMTITMIALWVLAIIARPYVWWKIGLLLGMIALSALPLLVPFLREFLALDPSDWGHNLIALSCAGIGIALIEIGWWIDGRVRHENRRLLG
jgi:cation-transporting P-type ATPase E